MATSHTDDVTGPRCTEIAWRAGSWVAGRLLNDCEDALPVSFGDWFKAPLALAQCGDRFAGNAVLNRILLRFGGGPGKDGLFEARPSQEDLSFPNIMYCYKQAVCLAGATALGRWDVASTAATESALAGRERRGLSRFGDYVPGWGHGGVVSCAPTAMMGIYLIHRNELKLAGEVGNFLVDILYESQPNAVQKGELVVYWDAARETLMTDDHVASIDELAWYRERRVLRCVDARCERQHNYHPGLSAAFLAELFAATKEEKYLKAARHLMEFDQACTVISGWPSHCKAAWGAANILLFSPVSESGNDWWQSLESHMKHVVSHAFMANSSESGSFGTFHFPLHDLAVTGVSRGLLQYSKEPGIEPGTHMVVGTELNLTAEFVYELAFVARALAVSSAGKTLTPAKRNRESE